MGALDVCAEVHAGAEAKRLPISGTDRNGVGDEISGCGVSMSVSADGLGLPGPRLSDVASGDDCDSGCSPAVPQAQRATEGGNANDGKLFSETVLAAETGSTRDPQTDRLLAGIGHNGSVTTVGDVQWWWSNKYAQWMTWDQICLCNSFEAEVFF